MFGLGAPEAAFLLIFFIPGLISAGIASRRGRNRPFWFIAGGVCPILIIVLLFLKPLRSVKGVVKQCPACKEFIKWGASRCRYCQIEIQAP
jgi:hypothetical protein